MGSLVQRAAFAYLFIGIVDFAYQRKRNEKSLRMDKQEVKDEAKAQDLPPEVRAMIRRRQMEAARARMMAAVPTADVVVTNPTHFSVALRYDAARGARPRSSPRARTSSPCASARSPPSTACRSSPTRRWRARCYARSRSASRSPRSSSRPSPQVLAYVYRIGGAGGLRHDQLLQAAHRKYSDLVAAGAVVLVVVMMIVPLPPIAAGPAASR